MNVHIHWTTIRGKRDPKWSRSRVLYAYLAPDGKEILYVGKADGKTSTVRRRWNAADKDNFWRDLERRRGIDRHKVIVGVVDVGRRRQLRRELLADLESLLISREQPWGNIQYSNERNISRPGMAVRCSGIWPGNKVYIDE